MLFSCQAVSDSVTSWAAHSRLFYPPPSPRVCSHTCQLSQWCYLTISSSFYPFSFSFQSFSASGSFPISWIFASGVQSFGASASTSILLINIQDRFPLGFIGLISLQYMELLRFFSSTTIQKHQLFGAQTFLWSNFHIFPYVSTGKTIALTIWIFVGKMMPLLFNIPLGLS